MQEVNRDEIEINKSMELMTNYVTGHLHSRMFYFVLQHNLCDILEEGPKHYTEIAKTANIKCENTCYRVLRYFVPHGLWSEDKDNIGTFSKTSCSSMFTKGGKLRSVGLLQTHEVLYKLLETLPKTLESGKSEATRNVFNVDSFWNIFKDNKEYKNIFTQAMKGCTELELNTILNRFDFSQFKTIVDVGGGMGNFVGSIVEKNQKVKGISFDMNILSDTTTEQKTHHQNIEHVTGNFFESVPEADCYVIKHVLHNWSDEDCSRILKTISKGLRKNGQVFVFDTVINPKSYNKLELYMDILMMQTLNSKERTINEWTKLFDNSGFKIESVSSDSRPNCLVLKMKE